MKNLQKYNVSLETLSVIKKVTKGRVCNVEARRMGMYRRIFFQLKFQISNVSLCTLPHTHLDKLIKAYLPILVQITCSHQVF